ncbi:hypothetical protein K2173_019708 [Erythroxylum novogranatense]|uniref:DRBM domain-containing protein n=1 Tax=Erythroxylum novogranatense TaxID=1862640 RepID=A0AAV8SMW0_9ROSI|nr:hypothetical protein K2173_019708 [Erythroxylum novogranatense]
MKRNPLGIKRVGSSEIVLINMASPHPQPPMSVSADLPAETHLTLCSSQSKLPAATLPPPQIAVAHHPGEPPAEIHLTSASSQSELSAATPATPQPQITSSSDQIPELFMYKAKLHEYLKKSSLPLPVYSTVDVGTTCHEPKFRASVIVDGEKFTSPNTFSRRKTAEHAVAKFALECTLKRIKEKGCPRINQEHTVFWKSILHEFAVKMKLQVPIYNTVKTPGLLPSFVCSVVFDGLTYSGKIGKNKKEAEQLAAHAVILSLLDSKSGEALSKIIRSKNKLFAAFDKVKGAASTQRDTSPMEVEAFIVPKLMSAEPQATSGMLSCQSESRMQLPSSEEISFPIEFMQEDLIDAGPNCSKRQKIS